MSLLRTPLYDTHVALGGKMVEFGGWELPVQYTSIIEEHKAVRLAAGLFDVSHMGEIIVRGKDALTFLNCVCTNDFTSMLCGKCRYSPMCYDDGGTVDDLLIYKRSDDEYMIVVNAANILKDYEWLMAHNAHGVELEDISDKTAMMALQGGAYRDVLAGLNVSGGLPEKFYEFHDGVAIGDVLCTVSNTGYTGEPGVEIYCAAQDAPFLFADILAAGKRYGLLPCGLGARDTLRFECAMPLYGHELSDAITPLECGLGAFVKTDKRFVGREALLSPPARRRVGLEIIDRGVSREGCKVYAGEREVGFVTSGMPSPSLNKNLAMALVSADAQGEPAVEVRGRLLAVREVPLPFYRAGNK